MSELSKQVAELDAALEASNREREVLSTSLARLKQAADDLIGYKDAFDYVPDHIPCDNSRARYCEYCNAQEQRDGACAHKEGCTFSNLYDAMIAAPDGVEDKIAIVSRANAELRSKVESVLKQIDKLQQWKAEAMAVEREWDAWAVAKLLDLPLGKSIRAGIQPAIERLLRRNAELEEDAKRIDKLEKAIFVTEQDTYIELNSGVHFRIVDEDGCGCQTLDCCTTLREAIDKFNAQHS